MPRAKRYHIPGYVWHITHRCHKREFLLKFARDRRRWLHWLFEAKKRYGLCIIDYIVTSNHIHLLVEDTGRSETIGRSIQLIAGRTAQEFNQRKSRKGAFWQDRYHATAVETGKYLRQCIVYIDMNMVRAGAAAHPCQWESSGYNEIQNPRQRYRLIDRKRLSALVGSADGSEFIKAHASWIDEALRLQNSKREVRWTQSVAVGSKRFVEYIKEKLGYLARSRKSRKTESAWELRESSYSYGIDFHAENGGLRQNNRYFWEENIVPPDSYSGPTP